MKRLSKRAPVRAGKVARRVEPTSGDVVGFAYEALDGRKATALKEAAARIRRLHAESLKSCIEIGRMLTKAKRSLPHGGWTEWLEAELGLNDRTAQNYMRVAEVMKGKTADVGDLSPSLLLEIVSSKTPDVARDEILGRVRSGEAVTVRESRKLIASAKGTAGAPAVTRTFPTPGAAPAAALPSSPIAAPAAPIQAVEAEADPMALAAEAIEAVGVRAMASALLRHMLGDEERDDLRDGDIPAAFVDKVYRKAATLPAATIEALMRDLARGVAMVASDAVSERRAPSTAPAALEISTRRGDIAEAHRTKIAGAFTALAEAERRAGMTGARVDPAALIGKKPPREPEPAPADDEEPFVESVRYVAEGHEFD